MKDVQSKRTQRAILATATMCLFLSTGKPVAAAQQTAVGMPPPLIAAPGTSLSQAQIQARALNDPALHAELSARFLRAVDTALTASLDRWHDGGLIALHFLERHFDMHLGTSVLVARITNSGRPLPALVREEPVGVVSSKPIENQVDFETVRQQAESLPFKLGDETLAMLVAYDAVLQCLPDEAAYNARFLAYLDTLDWPEHTEWTRYALNAGFLMHGCIDERAFRRQTEHLLAPLVSWLQDPEHRPDLKLWILFGLAVTERLAVVPVETVLDLIRLQGDEGSWTHDSFAGNSPNGAAVGAFVIADLLHAAGQPLPRRDFIMTSPLVPATPLPPSSRRVSR